MANETTPILTGKDGIRLKKKLRYILTCPKCEKDMDVTSIKAGTHIQCAKCENVTLRPDYDPPWWAKTKNFVVSLISALIIGIISTYVVGKIISSTSENYQSNKNKINYFEKLKVK